MKRTRFCYPNRTFILMLIPLFLIISSSVYPAIISSIENREMLIMAEVVAQIEEDNQIKRGTYANNHHHERLKITGSYTASSPTPGNPSPITTNSSHSPSVSPSATSPTFVQPNKTPIIQDQGQDLMTATAINAGDLVHVLWTDDTPGNNDIFYKRDGADFDPTTRNLSTDAGSSSFPAIAVAGNVVHVVWVGNSDILYKRSIDSGGRFGALINLSNNAGSSGFPAIAASGNILHVVWQDNTSGNNDILYRRSTDGGASFTEPTKNLSSNAGHSAAPAITVSDNNIHVVWNDSTPGNFDILHRRSLNGGSTFPNIIENLSNNAGISQVPAIAVSDNNVHVAWTDDTPGNNDTLYRRSTDGGASFTEATKNLSDNAGNSVLPKIAVSGNSVHVVWQDTHGKAPGNDDILYRRSVDGGTTFPNVIKNLSDDPEASINPEIAVSGNNVYVVWDNGISLANSEIVYRTSPDNGSTFPAIITDLSGNTGSSQNPAIAVT